MLERKASDLSCPIDKGAQLQKDPNVNRLVHRLLHCCSQTFRSRLLLQSSGM